MASFIRVAATLVALSVSAPAFAELEWFNYNASGSSFRSAPWQRTGWVPGYVIIRSGERFEGDIRKLKVNGSLAEIHIRIVDGKKKRTLELPLESLRQYGPRLGQYQS